MKSILLRSGIRKFNICCINKKKQHSSKKDLTTIETDTKSNIAVLDPLNISLKIRSICARPSLIVPCVNKLIDEIRTEIVYLINLNINLFSKVSFYLRLTSIGSFPFLC